MNKSDKTYKIARITKISKVTKVAGHYDVGAVASELNLVKHKIQQNEDPQKISNLMKLIQTHVDGFNVLGDNISKILLGLIGEVQKNIEMKNSQEAIAMIDRFIQILRRSLFKRF